MNTTNAAMQESGVEWIGAIPQDWKVKIIKRDFDIKLGKMLQPLQKTELDTEEYYLKTSNIYWDGVDISHIKKMWFSPLDKANTELQYNDLLVCEGGDVGRSALWKEEITPCYIQNAINRVRPIHNASTKYLYYWLFLLKHSGYIDAMVSRITIAHLTAEKLERLVFLLPPCSEQQAIAQYLDERCGKLDKIIAIKQQQIKTLDALRQSIIYQAVTKGLDASVPLVDSGVEWLGAIPKGWKVTKAKYVSEIFIPQRNKPIINSDFGCYWVTMENMNNPIISETDKFISEEAQKDAGSKILPKLSVIASCVGSFGTASINTVDVIINQQLQAYIPRVINPYYLRYLVSISEKYFEQVATKTTLVYVNGEKFACLPVLIPTTEEQQQIADHLDQETQRLDQLKANLNQQINVLTDYKKSLIYECVTGKKRIINAG